MSSKTSTQQNSESSVKTAPPATVEKVQANELPSLVQRAQQDPGRLSPSEILTLQQTNGNQSVNRMLAGSGRVSGNTAKVNLSTGLQVARYPSPDSDNFWEDLRQDAGTTMRDVLSSNERALQQFEQDIGAGESSDESIMADLIDFALDIAQATPAQKLAYKVLQKIYKQLMAVRSGPVQLAAFGANVRDAHEQFQRQLPRDWSSVNEDSPDLFRELKTLMDGESSGNESGQRTQAVSLIRSADDNIPPYRRIMQTLIKAWVGSAADQTIREGTIDLGDPSGFSTGYVRIYADIVPNMQGEYLRHSFRAINIDDVDNPDGTRRAITTAWGEDFFIDELPFPGMIYLNMGSTTVSFRKTDRTATEDLNGWDADVVNVNDRFRESTIETRRRMYFEHIRPRVQHLQNDD